VRSTPAGREPGDHQPAQLVDVRRHCPDDYVVRAGHGRHLRDARHITQRRGHRSRPARLGLDQNVCAIMYHLPDPLRDHSTRHTGSRFPPPRPLRRLVVGFDRIAADRHHFTRTPIWQADKTASAPPRGSALVGGRVGGGSNPPPENPRTCCSRSPGLSLDPGSTPCCWMRLANVQADVVSTGRPARAHAGYPLPDGRRGSRVGQGTDGVVGVHALPATAIGHDRPVPERARVADRSAR
jgi:hypothetical protein